MSDAKPKAGSGVAQPVSLREQAYQRIRTAILSGDLPPETLLTEKQLAASIGIGRMPVREALQQLAREGFVRIIPYRGALVRPVTMADLLEVYEFRLGLEPVAAALAAQRATDQEIQVMFQLLGVAASLRDGRSAAERGQDIHRSIFLSARNRRISDALQAVQGESLRIRRLTVGPDRAYSPNAVAEHRSIIEAIRDRDPKLAETRMRDHILAGLRWRLAQIAL